MQFVFACALFIIINGVSNVNVGYARPIYDDVLHEAMCKHLPRLRGCPKIVPTTVIEPTMTRTSKTKNVPRTMNGKGLQIIKEAECADWYYFKCMELRVDEISKKKAPTIGYGHTCNGNAAECRRLYTGVKITQEKAESLLRKDIKEAEQLVNRKVKVPLNDGQFSALVSLAFNIPKALVESRLIRELNKGNYAVAAGEFKNWRNSAGKPKGGLIKRRQKECNLFLTGDQNANDPRCKPLKK